MSATNVKRNELSLLTSQYELFCMEQNENIEIMFNMFHTILDELMSLSKHYDYIDKILHNLAGC